MKSEELMGFGDRHEYFFAREVGLVLPPLAKFSQPSHHNDGQVEEDRRLIVLGQIRLMKES